VTQQLDLIDGSITLPNARAAWALGEQQQAGARTARAMDLEITPLAGSLPPDFDELVVESVREGYRFLERMRRDWASGAALFSGPGECLFRAHFGPQTVGICGRTCDPYAIGGRVGRIRHLYVRRAARNQGVGSRLLTAALSGAELYFSDLRLRSSNAGASTLYQTHGFRPVADDAGATHRLDLRLEAVNLATTPRRTR
jgi:GNAT superfamily N-acetyltransferase